MNPLVVLGLVQTVGNALSWIWQTANTNQDVITKVEQEVPVVLTWAEQIVSTFLPNATKAQQALQTAAVLNTSLVKYAQQAINLILSPSPLLDVDGYWGPKTDAAFRQLQSHLGVTVDGILGKLTEEAIAKALPNLKLA